VHYFFVVIDFSLHPTFLKVH